MGEAATGHIQLSRSDNVSIIEFFHPAHNSLPGYLLDQLTHAIQNADHDPLTTVILIRSAGERTFCAGASFDELISIQSPEAGKQFFMGFANVINACRTSSKLIVGRVHGKAIGGGVGIAAAMDYCIASKWASIKLSELALGIGPFVVGPVVQRKIGLSAFSQMAINASEWQTATWGKEKGLFTEVFDSTQQLDDYLVHFLNTLSKMNPEAMKNLKSIFWEGTEHWDTLLEKRAEFSGNLVLSKFTREAIEAFKQKA